MPLAKVRQNHRRRAETCNLVAELFSFFFFLFFPFLFFAGLAAQLVSFPSRRALRCIYKHTLGSALNKISPRYLGLGRGHSTYYCMEDHMAWWLEPASPIWRLNKAQMTRSLGAFESPGECRRGRRRGFNLDVVFCALNVLVFRISSFRTKVMRRRSNFQ